MENIDYKMEYSTLKVTPEIWARNLQKGSVSGPRNRQHLFVSFWFQKYKPEIFKKDQSLSPEIAKKRQFLVPEIVKKTLLIFWPQIAKKV